MCGKFFYAMNKFGTAYFSLFVIDAWQYIFKATTFIRVSFIHKFEVFSNIFIREISNMPLMLYFNIFFYF